MTVHRLFFFSAGILALLLILPASAQERTEGSEPVPPEQRIAPPQGKEPEVTIIQRPHMTIKEYRSGGRVYMVRVDPDWGPAYYLVDEDGDGSWDQRMGGDISVPQWTLFEW